MILLVHVPKVLVAQSCLILCDPMNRGTGRLQSTGCSPPTPLSMGFSGKNTGMDCHSLLQGIFLTQGSNPGLPLCRQILYHLSHQGMSPNHPANLQVNQLLPRDSSWWEPKRAGFRVQDRAKAEEGGGWGFSETSWGSRSWGAAEESTDWDRAAAVSTLHGAAGGSFTLEQGLQERVGGSPASWDRLRWVC